ncbi:MAG: acetyl-CoA C-acetyltransferase, partial [Lysobacterales bacterium]
MNQDPVVIVAARRTPIGSFQGKLAPLNAIQLSAAASQAALTDAGLSPSAIDEALIGCVLPAAIGQAPARQAVLAAGLPLSVGATTVNKVCGSGMKAAMLGHDLLLAGSASIVLAGGMESMSNAPYMLPKARAGYRMGHQEVLDHMFFDGLQNPYDGHMMGHFADATAREYGFTREMQDEYAIESVNRALTAAQNGSFADEIVTVAVKNRRNEALVDRDEEPDRCELDKIPTLRPAFDKDG